MRRYAAPSGVDAPRGRVKRIAGLLVLASLAMGGCTTVRSTKIGAPRHMQEVGGIPVMVQRPRWLKVTHREIVFGREEAITVKTTTPGAEPDSWREMREVAHVCEVTPEVIEVGELYAVDILRPFVGDLKGGLGFPDKSTDPRVYQYPISLNSDVTDKTIQTLKDAVPTLAGLSKGKSASEQQAAGLFVMRSTILRVEFYDLTRKGCPVYVLPTPAACFASVHDTGS